MEKEELRKIVKAYNLVIIAICTLSIIGLLIGTVTSNIIGIIILGGIITWILILEYKMKKKEQQQ